MGPRRRALTTATLVAAVSVTGCGDGSDGDAESVTTSGDSRSNTGGSSADDQQFPEVLEATATMSAATWSFEVTMSSPYDTPERYADGWRVLGPDNEVYGEHTLIHDHAAEQPFTRTQSGVEIPEGVDEVTIEGRDLVNGYGGATVTVDLGSS